MIKLVFTEFTHMVIEILPFFIGAVVLSSLLETKINSEKLLSPFIKGKFAVIWTCILGGLLPGCACATVPLAKSLKSKNAGLGVTACFLMVAPLLGPHTIILCYGLLGLKFTVWRIITALIGGIVMGYLFSYLESRKMLSMPETTHTTCTKSNCSNPACHHPKFWEVTWKTTRTLGLYFLIGLFIASALTVLIPKDMIPSYIGTGPLAYLIAALVGIPVYVCEGEEIPITRALLNLGLGAGPAFTFMMGAVGTCIPTILMAKKIIGNKPVMLYVAIWFAFATLSGYFFSLV
ncbi:hypothetical protein HOG98_08200 [bacterium]|jgi:uncharacterized protein|nr:hypothetical protein [bacterium]